MPNARATLLLAGEPATCRHVLGLGLRRAADGTGGDARDQAQMLHDLASVQPSAATYAIIQYLALRILQDHGSDKQRGRCEEILDGTVRVAFCLTEAASGTDAFAALTTSAERVEGRWRVTGRKRWVAGAGSAHLLLVAARSGPHPTKDVTLFLVPAERPGVQVVPMSPFAFHG